MQKIVSICKRSLKYLSVLTLSGALIILLAWLWIVQHTNPYIYDQTSNIPSTQVGLVLGTSPRTKSGGRNGYFHSRMHKAAELFHAGKVQRLIVSGDNRQVEYNEPVVMRDTLIALGVPTEAIVLDYAGFRTLDSVVRAKWVFGLDTVTIISQDWHNQRAVYIAQQYDLQAYAINADDASLRAGFYTQGREILAKVWMLIDIHVLQTTPTFPGPPEPIYPADSADNDANA